jgi:peptidyl-Asp metalloendopeptidase
LVRIGNWLSGEKMPIGRTRRLVFKGGVKMRKNLKANFGRTVFAVAATFFVTMFYIGSFSANAQKQVQLFDLGETLTNLADDEKSSIASVSETEISFNLKSIGQVNSKRLSFPLPDGKLYAAQQRKFEGFETLENGDFVWRGTLTVGENTGDVVLTFSGGAVSGLIYAGETVYEIVTRGERQILVELDQRKFPDCAGEITSYELENKFLDPVTWDNTVLNLVDSGNTIDVLVLYTSSVRSSLGGDTQARNFAQQAISSTNTAYINSQITQRVRLVNAQLSPVSETGSLSSELSAIRSNSTVASLRNQYNADLVAMISNSGGGCGIGYLMGSTSGNSGNAFTVTARTCAIGNLSFAHELGHNMGSAHNPENGSGGTYSYSYGHWVNGSFRTVMSYSNPCSSGCTRRSYFSNPSVNYNGVPTGTSTRNNARSINNTDTVIANYRMAGN